MTRHRTAPLLPIAVALAILLLAIWPRPAAAQGWGPADTRAAIRQAAAEFGVSRQLLDRIVSCETGETYDPWSVGDRGRSHGAIQLHERGLLPHYRKVMKASPYNPYAALSYLARVATGEWRRAGVTLEHWSCY